MAKIVPIEVAAALIKNDMTVMCGGFLGLGAPNNLLDVIAELDVNDLTIICNDGGNCAGYGLQKLIAKGQVKKLIASHIGTTPKVGDKMTSGELIVELVPQGTLAERIRAGGAGLGGILTPTGLGTIVAEKKEIITVDGRQYLLEKPLRADIALINGYKIDKLGNVWYKGTTRNFNVVMATAADIVIAEADQIVEVGEIEPENVVTQGILVDYITNRRK